MLRWSRPCRNLRNAPAAVHCVRRCLLGVSPRFPRRHGAYPMPASRPRSLVCTARRVVCFCRPLGLRRCRWVRPSLRADRAQASGCNGRLVVFTLPPVQCAHQRLLPSPRFLWRAASYHRQEPRCPLAALVQRSPSRGHPACPIAVLLGISLRSTTFPCRHPLQDLKRPCHLSWASPG
jgi:hypothetical protein